MGREARRNRSAEKARSFGYKKTGTTVPSAAFMRRETTERRNVLRGALIVNNIAAIAAMSGGLGAVLRRGRAMSMPVVTKLRQRAKV